MEGEMRKLTLTAFFRHQLDIDDVSRAVQEMDHALGGTDVIRISPVEPASEDDLKDLEVDA